MSTIRTTEHDVRSEPRPVANGQVEVTATKVSPVCELGICSTCIHQSTCLFLKASHNPVWFCDEFCDDSAAAGEERKAPVVESKPASEVNFGEAQRIGLCTNCESRKECMHRRPGEPVWECEDYK